MIICISNFISFVRRGRRIKDVCMCVRIFRVATSAIFESVVKASSSVKKREKYGETTRERAVRWVGRVAQF